MNNPYNDIGGSSPQPDPDFWEHYGACKSELTGDNPADIIKYRTIASNPDMPLQLRAAYNAVVAELEYIEASRSNKEAASTAKRSATASVISALIALIAVLHDVVL